MSNKIEVTDAMIEKAVHKYHNQGWDLNSPQFTRIKQDMKATLEAVFAMIESVSTNNAQPDNPVKEFVKAWDKQFHENFGKQVKICEGCKVNLYKDVCDCANDGWIEWKEEMQTNDSIKIGTKAEIKIDNKIVVDGIWQGFSWKTEAFSPQYNPSILAYRIIQEPKEEHPLEQANSAPMTHEYTKVTGATMAKEEKLYSPSNSPSNPPPESYLKQKEKIPTLLQSADQNYAWCTNKESGNNYQLIKLMSEYLDKYMKEKD